MKKVAITGISLVTPLGLDKNENWNALLSNKSGITEAEGFKLNADYPIFAGEIKSLINCKNKWLQIFGMLMEEIEKSGDVCKNFNNKSFLSIGSAFPGMEPESFHGHRAIINKIRRHWKFDCGININSNTCAAGNFALFNGANIIKNGYAGQVCCVGIDILSEYLFSGFYALRSLSRSVSKPFSYGRDGLTLGEGGALIMLEDYEHAKQRGADIYCEYGGFGASIDNGNLTGMDKTGKGILKSFERAMADSGLTNDLIDLVSAHGTGTRINDETEAKAVIDFFEGHPKLTVFKSYTGHAMGASSMMSAALLSLCIKYGKIIRINNLVNPEFKLNYAYNNEDKKINYAINNSFGFGGINSCLVLKGVNG